MPQITMLNMDCLDFMAKLPDKAFELAIVEKILDIAYYSYIVCPYERINI